MSQVKVKHSSACSFVSTDIFFRVDCVRIQSCMILNINRGGLYEPEGHTSRFRVCKSHSYMNNVMIDVFDYIVVAVQLGLS